MTIIRKEDIKTNTHRVHVGISEEELLEALAKHGYVLVDPAVRMKYFAV